MTAAVVSLADYRAARDRRFASPPREAMRETLKDQFIQAFIRNHMDTPIPHIRRALALAEKMLDAGAGFCTTASAMRDLLDALEKDNRGLSPLLDLLCRHLRARLHSGVTQRDYHRAVVVARRTLEDGGNIDTALYNAIDQLPPWSAA
jgi:hypothetical protein